MASYFSVPKAIIALPVIIGLAGVTGCQPNSAPDTDTQAAKVAPEPTMVPQSDSAAARIEDFEADYVTARLQLQQRLQAEYESLSAADDTDSDVLLLNNPNETDTSTDNQKSDQAGDDGANSDNGNGNSDNSGNDTADNNADQTNGSQQDPAAAQDVERQDTERQNAEINTSTEVGERDLTVLKNISLDPNPPKTISETVARAQYRRAMKALYMPEGEPIGSQDIDTLLNIAALIPQVFEHSEIAQRLSIKSPALARLIVQHQVWQEIEIQQAADMQAMKAAQQAEFEALMNKFNDTIADYDKQIAKYEQTLKEYQQE